MSQEVEVFVGLSDSAADNIVKRVQELRALIEKIENEAKAVLATRRPLMTERNRHLRLLERGGAVHQCRAEIYPGDGALRIVAGPPDLIGRELVGGGTDQPFALAARPGENGADVAGTPSSGVDLSAGENSEDPAASE